MVQRDQFPEDATDVDTYYNVLVALQDALVDEHDNGVTSLTVTPERLREVQRGQSYLVNDTNVEMSHDEEWVILFENPAGSGGFLEFTGTFVDAEGKTEVETYQNVTKDTAGTPFTPVNNRTDADSSITNVEFDPVISGGTQRVDEHSFASGEFNIGSSQGSIISPVVAPGDNYAIVLRNKAGATIDMDFVADWLEHDEDKYPAITQVN